MKTKTIQNKFPHIFAIFTNPTKKLFHIWQTKQENYKQNVTIVNAFSKSKSALSKNDSAQSAATTSFLRVIASTNQKDWELEYEELGNVSESEHKDLYKTQTLILENDGYTCITRSPKHRFQSGRYAGQKWVVRKITKMYMYQINDCAYKMLEDCLNDNIDIQETAKQVTKFALKPNSPIHNISELWNHVFHNYSEYGDMYKRAA